MPQDSSQTGESRSAAEPLALATGAGIGIGRATALALGKEGYRVIVTDVLTDEGQAVARQIDQSGGAAEFHPMDVTDSDAVNAVVASVETRYARGFDVLVNNAGIARKTPMASLTDAEWDTTLETDLKGMMRVARAALPRMRRQGRGAIVCLASVAGAVQGWAEHVPYSAAKGGVVGLVRALAAEVAPDGVRVNGIAPGLVRTAQVLDAHHSLGAGKLAQAVRTIPLGRVGEPEDIADVAVFLASDKARYITGQVIVADGGRTVATRF